MHNLRTGKDLSEQIGCRTQTAALSKVELGKD